MATLERPNMRKPRGAYNIKRIKDLVPKVLETNGNVSKAMKLVGYPESTASNPHIVTRSKTYIEESNNVLQRLEGLRMKFIRALEEKDVSDEATFTLSATLKALTHDIQLLSGGKTENVGLEEQRETLRAVLIDLRTE